MSRLPRSLSEESLSAWNWILVVFRKQTRQAGAESGREKQSERERKKASKNWRARGRRRKDRRGRSSDPSVSHDAEYESRHVAQNPWVASERDAPDERAGREKRRKKGRGANAGYFSRWKQTRYVPGNFNRPRFDVSGWTLPIRADGGVTAGQESVNVFTSDLR